MLWIVIVEEWDENFRINNKLEWDEYEGISDIYFKLTIPDFKLQILSSCLISLVNFFLIFIENLNPLKEVRYFFGVGLQLQNGPFIKNDNLKLLTF